MFLIIGAARLTGNTYLPLRYGEAHAADDLGVDKRF